MAIHNQEALDKRADNLGAHNLNGLKFVLVTLHPVSNPTEAHLEVHFYNNKEISNILADTQGPSHTRDPSLIFPISGGHRISGGLASDQVKVTAISGNPTDTFLELTVKPIGDYSTYTLSIDYQNIDPVFSEIHFKFRPGCFNTDCAPDWKPAPEPKLDPAINYLAKDYDSFRHTMIAAMMERVPGWQPSSEADLDQVLLELFSAAADELSDYQDRVMNEAYLSTARKRVSLARHARLMDYHIHQGNQASTWLAVKLKNDKKLDIPKSNPEDGLIDLTVWSGSEDINAGSSVIFVTRTLVTQTQQHMHFLLNQMGLYTWGGSIPTLAAGDTTADLKLTDGTNAITDKASAVKVQNLIRSGQIRYLLVQENLNPVTGEIPGRDPGKRQLLRLLPGEQGAKAKYDPYTETVVGNPFTAQWFVRVRWEEEDKLRSNYCFAIDCTNGKVEDVSLFYGNLVEVYQGLPVTAVFKEPTPNPNEGELYYEKTERWGAICKLPQGPLAYKDTPPGGEIPPESTLKIDVIPPGSSSEEWDERINLIHSNENDAHFIVETDEMGESLIRFGNGRSYFTTALNGKRLPDGAEVHCLYQIGIGTDGNIGADKLFNFNKNNFSEIVECWNPFEVTNGRAPEPVAEIIRRVTEAYRFRQLRAITLKDYADRASELPGVSNATARYAWTGSWRTVQVTIDPEGTTTLDEKLRKEIELYLDAVRLIGEDLEIRPPRFVPLEIHVSLCVLPDYWPEDIKYLLEQEFSDGFTKSGDMAFFHPDRWTFGQELWASQIIGRIQSVEGVDHVITVSMKRWNEVTPGTDALIELRHNEIIQVKNDPDHMEKGFMDFDIRGGRQ